MIAKHASPDEFSDNVRKAAKPTSLSANRIPKGSLRSTGGIVTSLFEVSPPALHPATDWAQYEEVRDPDENDELDDLQGVPETGMPPNLLPVKGYVTLSTHG